MKFLWKQKSQMPVIKYDSFKIVLLDILLILSCLFFKPSVKECAIIIGS